MMTQIIPVNKIVTPHQQIIDTLCLIRVIHIKCTVYLSFQNESFYCLDGMTILRSSR